MTLFKVCKAISFRKVIIKYKNVLHKKLNSYPFFLTTTAYAIY